MLQLEPDLITTLPTGGFLIVPVKLIKQLQSFRQLSFSDTEAGGLLIGCKRSEGSQESTTHIELTDCSIPNWFDKRSRFSFVRRSKAHLNKVYLAWKKSNSQQTYIGEWHTHPESHPTPSWEDVCEWKVNLEGMQAILIIVGQKSDWIAYWDGNKVIPIDGLKPDTDMEV
jgi:integrative and conjugative element protein (TIGR02256 family)